MGEFLHNLSWQALTNDNDSIQIKFEATTELIKNINYLIQKEIYKNKKKTIEINQNVGGQLNNKVIETHKDMNQEIEDEIVRDIINNDDTDYKPINVPPTVKTEDEIDQNNLLWNENFLKTELAKRERDFQIIDDINAKYQADLLRKAVDPSDGQLTNEQINQTGFNRTGKNEPLAVPLPSGSLDVLDKFVNKLSDEVNADIPDQYPTPPSLTQIKSEVVSMPTLQDILTGVVKVEDDALKDLQNVRDEVIRLDFPKQTGIRSVDEQNLDDYYDTLQQIRPDLFIDEDDDVPNFASMTDLNSLMDTPSNVPYLLVPTDVDIGSNDPAEILADPNVTTIIPPAIEDPSNALLPLSNFFSNFVPSSDEDDLISKEMETDKIILTDDSDVMLIDPDNIQKDEKPFKFLSEDVVELPSEEEDMEVVRTKTIVLKRKNTNNEVAQVKKQKLDTEIAVRGVVPKKEHEIPANADIPTIERLPWVDFKTILDNTDLNKRTQVILDILQNNMPISGDDIYYIYHDQKTNTFSIEVDENSDEIQDFFEGILVIDARLKIEDLSKKDRTYLKKLRKSKLQVLRKQYKAHALAEV